MGSMGKFSLKQLLLAVTFLAIGVVLWAPILRAIYDGVPQRAGKGEVVPSPHDSLVPAIAIARVLFGGAAIGGSVGILTGSFRSMAVIGGVMGMPCLSLLREILHVLGYLP
jgi:hypothetical protein